MRAPWQIVKLASPRALRSLDRCVRPALAYCIGSLRVAVSAMSRISKCHNTMPRRTLGPPKGEAAAEYMKTAMSMVAEMRALHDIEPRPQTCRRLSHSWAGRRQSLAEASSDRVAYRALRYYDRAWMTAMERWQGSQLHHRTVGIWRWESDFWKR